MFQFPGLPSSNLCVQQEDARGSLERVSSFGHPRIAACTRLPRGLSQCPTSFIGIWRQGIHRKPLVASPRDAENLLLFNYLLSAYKYFLIFEDIIFQSLFSY